MDGLDGWLGGVGMEGCTARSCCGEMSVLGSVSLSVSRLVTDLGWLYLPMHCLFTNGGPLGQSAGRSTRHRRRIDRQKADERHREINVDGVVERDTECVRDINEFGATDGYQSGRNLDTHIPMAALARLDTCPPAFTGDASCAMTCEVALNRFFCDFSPLCLCRAAAVCRSARFASFRECADVLQEREAEVFDLSRTAIPYGHFTPEPLPADPGASADRDAQLDAALLALQAPPEALLSIHLDGLYAWCEDDGGAEAGHDDDGAVKVGDGALAGGGDVCLERADEDVPDRGAPVVGGGVCALGAGSEGEGEAEGEGVCAGRGEAVPVAVGGGREQGGRERVRDPPVEEGEHVALVVEDVPCGRQFWHG